MGSVGHAVVTIALVVGCFAFAAFYFWWHRDEPPDGKRYPWVPLNDVLAVIRSHNWHWYKNNRCKYINVRMDTRSHSNLCVIYDRNGNPITLEELKFQEQGRRQ